MKIKTVVVSNYPMFKAGLKKILGPDIAIVSCFNDVSELLAQNTKAELAVLDEETSKDLAMLRSKMPSLAVLKLSLDSNTGYFYESINNDLSITIRDKIQSLADKISVVSGLEVG